MIAPGMKKDPKGEGYATRQELWQVSWDASGRAFDAKRNARIAIAMSIGNAIAILSLAAYVILG